MVVLLKRLFTCQAPATGLVVGIVSGPARISRVATAMLHGQEIAYGVVEIALDVGSHRVTVAGVIEVSMEVVERVRWRGCIGLTSSLPQMFTTRCFDQAIGSIVGVFGARLDAAVAEEDGLLSIIADGGDIAYGVKCIAQVL